MPIWGSWPVPDTTRIDAMRSAARQDVGFDVVVVSAGSEAAAAWWRERLEATRNEVVRREARVAVVVEPWAAGNGLGTLLAVQEAERALGIDLDAHLRAGGTAAVVHTAGKGTRLAPLTLAEHGDKPRVRLPGLVTTPAAEVPITLLEAVLRQTAPLAAGRAGRLSVFWGDQLFVPEADPAPAQHGVVIAARRLPEITAEAWATRGLHRYGLLGVDDRGEAAQLEKVDHRTFAHLVDTALDVSGGVFASLGAFHVSAEILAVLRQAFALDLAARGRSNADADWWMPLGLSEATYLVLRTARGEEEDRARATWRRMDALKPALAVAHPTGGLLGVEDMGADAWFWDFGTLAGYAALGYRLLDDGPEAEALRAFFGVDRVEGSVVVGSTVTGRVAHSVLVDTHGEVDVSDVLCVGVHAPRIDGSGLGYALEDDDPIALRPSEAQVDVPLP